MKMSSIYDYLFFKFHQNNKIDFFFKTGFAQKIPDFPTLFLFFQNILKSTKNFPFWHLMCTYKLDPILDQKSPSKLNIESFYLLIIMHTHNKNHTSL